MTITIAFGSDDNYARYLGCCILSILKRARREDSYCFYVLDNGISELNKAKLAQLQKTKPHELIFLKPDMTLLETFPKCSHIGVNAYLRLLLPELVPESLERLLYLDCDMIAMESLHRLWEADLQGHAVGVVKEFLGSFPPYESLAQRLNLEFYANTGMLLMDLKQIREKRLFQQTLEWITLHPDLIQVGDQDAINVVLAGHMQELHPRWNNQLLYCMPYKEQLSSPKRPQDQEICAVLRRPRGGILHYFSDIKPDSEYYPRPGKRQFRQIMAHSPWKELLPNRTLRQKIRNWKDRNPIYRRCRKFRQKIQNWLKGKPAK